jgi:hypothetical protein
MRADLNRSRMKLRAINELCGTTSTVASPYGWPCVSRDG